MLHLFFTVEKFNFSVALITSSDDINISCHLNTHAVRKSYLLTEIDLPYNRTCRIFQRYIFNMC
jgi:hypothetical protein